MRRYMNLFRLYDPKQHAMGLMILRLKQSASTSFHFVAWTHFGRGRCDGLGNARGLADPGISHPTTHPQALTFSAQGSPNLPIHAHRRGLASRSFRIYAAFRPLSLPRKKPHPPMLSHALQNWLLVFQGMSLIDPRKGYHSHHRCSQSTGPP